MAHHYSTRHNSTMRSLATSLTVAQSVAKFTKHVKAARSPQRVSSKGAAGAAAAVHEEDDDTLNNLLNDSLKDVNVLASSLTKGFVSSSSSSGSLSSAISSPNQSRIPSYVPLRSVLPLHHDRHLLQYIIVFRLWTVCNRPQIACFIAPSTCSSGHKASSKFKRPLRYVTMSADVWAQISPCFCSHCDRAPFRFVLI